MNDLTKPVVGIIMGSDSDLPVMQAAASFLTVSDIAFELDIVSAHRTPNRLFEYAQNAQKKGLKVIIAGAGGAAHLPGMVASLTTLPVIGVPIRSELSLNGLDSILSILQMPTGIPVATVALNGAENAAILAVRMLAMYNEGFTAKLLEHQQKMEQKVLKASNQVKMAAP